MKDLVKWHDVNIGDTFRFAGDLFRKISKMKAHSFRHDREVTLHKHIVFTMNKHMLCEIVQDN